MKPSNYIKAFRQAVELFRRTRCYENNLTVQRATEYQLRWVVRYHVLVEQNDYTWIDRFGRPESRRAFLRLTNKAIEEMVYVWKTLCFYDSNVQFFDNRTYLKRLRFSAQHFPILFHIMFLPHLRFLRKRVVVENHL